MDWAVILGSSSTVVSFVVFIGIVVWAMSKRRQPAFAAAANAPFALPDDGVASDAGVTSEQQQ